MRRPRGSGTIERVRAGFRARIRIHGTNVYGPVRETFAQAESDLRKLVKQHKQGQPVKAQAPTLGDWLVTYRDQHSQRLAVATFNLNETYRLRHLMDHPLYLVRLDRLRLQDCQAWVDGLQRHRYDKALDMYLPDGPLAPASVHRVAAYLRRALTVARQHGHIEANPMDGVLLPKGQRRMNRVLDPDELRPLLRIHDRTAAMIVVLVLTGMRRGELARLQWEHVHGDRLMVPGTKNAASLAAVPLADLAREAIEAQPRRGPYVFTTESGRPLSPRNMTRDIRARLREHGVPDTVRLHDLRGTFISLLVESGADIATVMAMARHASVRTTLGVYAQSRPAVQKAALGTMLDLIQEPSKSVGLNRKAHASKSEKREP